MIVNIISFISLLLVGNVVFIIDNTATKVGIPIVYAFDNGYTMPTIVSMESAVRAMEDSSFYEFTLLVPGNFKDENRKRFTIFEEKYKGKCSVDIVDMKDDYDCYYASTWGAAMYYRLSIPSILSSKDKAIYLDGDTIIRHDLQEMYNIQLENNFIGACLDYQIQRPEFLKKYNDKIDKYVCSGVLLLDCKSWRENVKHQTVLELCRKVKEYDLIYPDQDIINIVCGGRVKILSMKFMLCNLGGILTKGLDCFKNGPFAKACIDNDDELRKAVNDPTIVHFLGPNKPWKRDLPHLKKIQEEWLSIFKSIQKEYNFDDLKLYKCCGCCC